MDGREVSAHDSNVAQDRDGARQSRWSAVAPLVAWWWLVIAIAVSLFLGFGSLRAVQIFARPLGVLVLGIAIATSLLPLVSRLSRMMPRTIATIVIYLLIILVIVGIGWMVIPSFASQVQSFIDDAPQFFQRVQDIFTRWASVDGNSIVQTITSLVTGGGFNVLAWPITAADALLQTFIVLFVSFYALLIAPDGRNFILSLVPAHGKQKASRLLADMSAAMGGYVRGVALSAVLVGGFTYAGLYFLGVEYSLLLAILAAVLEIVPILGTLVSTIVIVIVAFFQSPQLALFAFIYMLILQQLEGNVIYPMVMSSQTDLSPLLSLFAFFAGGLVGGLLGALVAIPLAAALRVVVIELVAPMVRRWTGAKPSEEPEAEPQATDARA